MMSTTASCSSTIASRRRCPRIWKGASWSCNSFKSNFEDKVADPENGLDAADLSEKVVPEVLQPFEDSWRRPCLVLVGAHVVFGVGAVVLMRRVRKMV